ncbi:MAG: hypothetical protein PHQ10_06820 [Dehalococcoidales bacterium]|nr:hypothetical protein [Dehalococcoidales bacterium]
MQDVFPYSVTVAIPVARNDQDTAARGYQYREELTERLVFTCGGRWLGSGFGSLNKTDPYAAFDIIILFCDEPAAKSATTFAKKWLRDRGYTISNGTKMQYDGKAYVYWRKSPPIEPPQKPKTRKKFK